MSLILFIVGVCGLLGGWDGWNYKNGFPPMSRKLSTVIAPAGKNSRRILV
jgi:hypothetical protein